LAHAFATFAKFDAGLQVGTDCPQRRDVDLTSDVVDMLGAWWGESDSPTGADTLLFPGEGRSGHIAPTTITRRVLYPAMQRAGIPRQGPTGENRTLAGYRGRSESLRAQADEISLRG
jgi:hypothetical protein